MILSGITREEIIAWGGQEVFNQALSYCNSNDVFDVHYDDETLEVTGKIRQPGYDMKTGFKLEEKGRITSRCPCYANQKQGMICPHVVAIGIALWAMEADEVERQQATLKEEDWQEAPEEEGDFIEVEMTPKFYATVWGSRASLSIAVDAWYGEIDFPACSIQSDRTVYLPCPEDDQVRYVRSIKAEQAALEEVKKYGFEPGYKEGDLKLYTIDQQKVLNFLGTGRPALARKGWIIELAGSLEQLANSMPMVLPNVYVRKVGSDFDVKVTFDAEGVEISPLEVQAAVNRGDGYILRDGQVVLLDDSAIKGISTVLSGCRLGRGEAPEGWVRYNGVYAPYVAKSFDLLDCLDTTDRYTNDWAKQMGDSSGEAKYEPVALGKLESVLRPYQKQGVYWMRFMEDSGYAGLLADEMGLGKTLQTLTWLSLSTSQPSQPSQPSQLSQPSQPSLIICPTSLVRNWEAEAKKFTPWLKTLVISGPDRANDFKCIDSADIVITSYALLQRDFETAWYDHEFSAVVIDEAQHIKNAETKNAKAVKMLKCRRRLALTGTPVENSVMDIWSIFDFLMPDYLGDHTTFKATFEEPIKAGGAEDLLFDLKRRIDPFMLRRVKKTVAKDLPDKIVKVSYCPLDDESQREYNDALAKTRTAAGGLVKAKGFAKSKFEILAMLMKLRQLSSRGKREAFLEQLESAIEGGHKILVFSQFVGTLELLGEALKERGIPYCYLDGSTKDRLGECNRFNRTPSIPVFLISLMAGGTGLNLTGADMVMHYDPWWNPAVEDQATDRAHRIGQKKTVYVMKMIAEGTIEEKVLELQRRKQAVINATVSTTDAAVLEKLTAADLSELLS